MKNFVSLNVHDNVPYALSKITVYVDITPKYQVYLTIFFNIIKLTPYAEASK